MANNTRTLYLPDGGTVQIPLPGSDARFQMNAPSALAFAGGDSRVPTLHGRRSARRGRGHGDHRLVSQTTMIGQAGQAAPPGTPRPASRCFGPFSVGSCEAVRGSQLRAGHHHAEGWRSDGRAHADDLPRRQAPANLTGPPRHH